MGIITKIGETLGIKTLEFKGKDIDIKKQVDLYFNRQKELEALWADKEPENTEAPHVRKRETILKFKELSGAEVFIETGTYLALMMEAMQPHFKSLTSIEISEYLNQRAKNMLGHHTNLNFELGDSGVKMEEVVGRFKEPIIFWLDGHYSGGITGMADIETPIVAELEAIFAHPLASKHTILIDDARLFNGERDYPKMEDIKSFILSKKADAKISSENDILVIT